MSIGHFVETCCLIIKYLMLRRHTKGIISVQVKQKSISKLKHTIFINCSQA